MKVTWAPWRMEYIQAEPFSGCLFCHKHSDNRDEKNYVLFRTKLCFVILNLYPYNIGHLMVAPVRHVGDITHLSKKEICDMMDSVRKGVIALTEVYKPEGFNIGLNLGVVAGAGITDHLHIHVVPRWQGDTNFMPVLTNTKVIPQYLHKTYKALFPLFGDPESKKSR